MSLNEQVGKPSVIRVIRLILFNPCLDKKKTDNWLYLYGSPGNNWSENYGCFVTGIMGKALCISSFFNMSGDFNCGNYRNQYVLWVEKRISQWVMCDMIHAAVWLWSLWTSIHLIDLLGTHVSPAVLLPDCESCYCCEKKQRQDDIYGLVWFHFFLL